MAILHGFFRKTVSRGNYARIDMNLAFAPHPPDRVSLDNAKKLRLKLRLHLGYLVKEDSTAIGLLENAEAPAGCARERAAFVAEQLALD